MSMGGEERERQRRRRRVQRLKKIILGTVAALIIVPTITAIFLALCVHGLKGEVAGLQEQLAILEGQLSESMTVMAESDSVVIESAQEAARAESAAVQTPEAEPSAAEAEETETAPEEEPTPRRVYLTFDDGPSAETGVILDILKEYGVKATFFVVGKTDERSLEAYKRIVEEGHTLGLHSYSHVYSEIYASKEAFLADFEKLQDYLYEVTGQKCWLYRFPGGSSNKVSRTSVDELIRCLDERGITYFDWNVSSKDATTGTHSRDEIIRNTIGGMGSHQTCVILFHDSTAKKSTVEALPSIIEQIQAMDNTEILPITRETEPVQHRSLPG